MQLFRLMLLACALPLSAPASSAQGPSHDIDAVVAPIKALVAGVTARDSAAVAKALRSDGEATIVAAKPDGTLVLRHPNWADFLGGIKPGREKFEPRLSNIVVRIDGDMAMAWTPYIFLIDGKVHHCGVNLFDLIREDGSWKILNVTYTIRTSGCA